jgi:hypothetical protein
MYRAQWFESSQGVCHSRIADIAGMPDLIDITQYIQRLGLQIGVRIR